MSKTKYNDIRGIEESWENYAGSSVERFIKSELKKRAGYIYRSRNKEGDFYYLYGFMDYDQYEAWSNGDSSITPLFRVQLPNIENDVFAANLYTTSNTNKLVNLGQGVQIDLKYTSTSTNPSTQAVSDTYNEGTLIISRSANGSAFTEVGRITLQPTPHASETYQSIDITSFLADGDNIIRLRVEDNVTGSISNNINFNSIVNTTLRITNATSINDPLTTPQFMYYIEGQVAKTLNIEITQNGNTTSYAVPIGTSTYIEAPRIVTLSDTFQTGTIEVESWLSVDDTTLESTHIVNQFYFISGDNEDTVIIINNKVTSVTNYANIHFFDFTIYNKQSDVVVTVTDGITNFIDNYVFKDCEVNQVYSFYNVLQVESQLDTINAVVRIATNSSTESYSIAIDNREKMSPTSGADFILNPQNRKNDELIPNRIINDATGSILTSTFTGFNFINDGWVNDEDNYKVLRVPSGHTLNIQYDPLDRLTSGTTIELDYKVYNIFNDNDVVLSFSNETQNQDPLGFIMNATEAAFYTVNNQVKRDQDVMFQEETRTHMAINIIPNLSNSGLNYIRIFINGVMNREMVYSNGDIFKNGALSINIGSQNCDIDVFSIRVYKKALSASDIRQDYMSTIPSLEDKLAFKNANDILSANGRISFDKASVKYNTLVWVGQIPSKVTGNVEFKGKLKINILNDPDHSGEITNLRNKGQGSSSRTYWKWNQQYDWNKYEDDSVWTDGNGVEHTDGYRLTDNDPAATKLVAKLNWASSMQSHKMGSTALYTDLWREIVGGNGITNTTGYENVRVTVHEKPFMFFVQDTDSSTPVFYGLMTFGSGKYDKPTFGYNKNVFPDYLILEGSDNGMPLTNRQVPWFTDEVTYNAEEEYYEYADAGNLDYGMGNQNMINYFINAFNFAYIHSPRLRPYTSASDLVDPSYQYWNTSTYNVVRYDYITNDWVDAGATKTNCSYDVLNIVTQTGLTPTGNSETDNQAFIEWRISDFKNRVSVYYNVNDVLFSVAFLKMVAASDNRCKNTYEYLDPISHKICLAQDDMDTLMLTDNVGRKTKPYYVEEHDTYVNEHGQMGYYFNGQDNVFFSLIDLAFDAELRSIMKSILDQMRTVKFGESAEQCLQDYFFSVQEYFPAVAFNETARLLYEEASVAQEQGIYINGTPAISQSLGDQLQAEKQWFKRRLRYLQSWASADPFYVRSVISPSLNFRSILTTGGTNPSYQFTLTPWQWLYPKVGVGQTLGVDNTRVTAQNPYVTNTLSTDGNTDMFIYGADYYINFGEFGDKSIGETFQLAGKRLLEFSADSREVVSYEFKPRAMTINCPVLKRLCLYGCSTLSGSLNLENESKLVEVDLRGTGLTTVVLPETGTLTTVYIPNLSSLTFINCPNASVTATNYSNLISLRTDNSSLVMQALANATDLANIDFRNININVTNASQSEKMYNLLMAENNSCTGTVQLNKTLTISEKNALVSKYGAIDSNENPLQVIYIRESGESLSISGDTSIAQGRTQTYTAVYDGNDATKYNWTVTNADHYTTNGNTCTITSSTESSEDITVMCIVNRIGASSMSTSMTIDVIVNIPISGISNEDYEIDKIGTITLPIQYSPANHTTMPETVSATMTSSSYGRILSCGTDQIVIEASSKVTDTVSSSTVYITGKDDEDNTFSGSFDLYFTNPVQQFIIHGITIWERDSE